MSEFLAHEPKWHAMETIMRIQAVKRWHMIDTSRVQTLAEHSANVALLAMLIARTAPAEFFDSYSHVACYALLHDAPEAFTGDIPTHTKRHLTGIDELENKFTHTLWKLEARTSTVMLTKMCDIADGIRFIRLHGVDLTGVHAQDGLAEKFAAIFKTAKEDYGWPQHVLDHVKSNLVFYAYERS